MAKAKKPEAPAAPVTNDTPGEPTEAEMIEQGLRPYTVLAGRFIDATGKTYDKGDVFFSAKDMAEAHPEKYAPGRVSPDGRREVSKPGLGENVSEQLIAGGYDVYAKDGLVWAYVPGQYGSPASPPLVDLAAAEEWISDNPMK